MRACMYACISSFVQCIHEYVHATGVWFMCVIYVMHVDECIHKCVVVFVQRMFAICASNTCMHACMDRCMRPLMHVGMHAIVCSCMCACRCAAHGCSMCWHVSMYVCLFVMSCVHRRVHVCMYCVRACMYVPMQVYRRVCLHSRMYVQHVFVFGAMLACIDACVCVMLARVDALLHACVDVCTHTCCARMRVRLLRGIWASTPARWATQKKQADEPRQALVGPSADSNEICVAERCLELCLARPWRFPARCAG